MNKFLNVVGIIIGIFLLVGCNKQGDEILIGEYGSLTGSTATFGQSVDKGVKIGIGRDKGQGGGTGKENTGSGGG